MGRSFAWSKLEEMKYSFVFTASLALLFVFDVSSTEAESLVSQIVPEDDITSEPTTLLSGASESEAAQVSSLWKKFQLAQGAEAPPPTAEIQAHNSWDSFLKKTFPEQKPVSQTGGKVASEAEVAGGPVQKAKTLKKKIKKQKKFNIRLHLFVEFL